MKTDVDIRTDVYRILKGSDLANAVSGELCRTGRPSSSDKEDIVISILDNDNGEVQMGYVNVNIYVPDAEEGQYHIENESRTKVLADMAANLFDVCNNGGGFRIKLQKQRIYDVDGKNEHVITNRLFYKYYNE